VAGADHELRRDRGAVRVGPQVRDTRAGFERTCYIGVPSIDGVDVVKLSAAIRITVTGP
jgi:hypothetical protein